jgi:hypothetical protein
MKFTRSLALSLVIILLLSSCSTTDIRVLQEENDQLKQKIADIELERDDYKNRLEAYDKLTYKDDMVPSIMYSDYEQTLRLIMSEVDLHISFGVGSPIVNKIMPNTVVKVLDAGLVESEELWLYVEIPVYDIPAHYKGWIKESETLELTKENKKLGYDSVTIKEGVAVYTCDTFEDIQKTKAEKAPYEMSVRIEKLMSGYAYVFFAGGWNFWVKEEDIIYAYDLQN